MSSSYPEGLRGRVSRWQDRRQGTKKLKATYARMERDVRREDKNYLEQIGRARLTRGDLQVMAQGHVLGQVDPDQRAAGQDANTRAAAALQAAGAPPARTLNPAKAVANAVRRRRNIRRGRKALKGAYAQAYKDAKRTDLNILRALGRSDLTPADLQHLAQGEIDQVFRPDSAAAQAAAAQQAGPQAQPQAVSTQDQIAQIQADIARLEDVQQQLRDQQAQILAQQTQLQAQLAQLQGQLPQPQQTQPAPAQTQSQGQGPAQSAPAQPTQAPAQPAAAQPAQGPAQPAPAQPAQAPAQAPAQPAAAQPGQGPAQPAPAQPAQAPPQPTQAPAQPAAAQPAQGPAQPAPAQPAQAPPQPTQAPAQPVVPGPAQPAVVAQGQDPAVREPDPTPAWNAGEGTPQLGQPAAAEPVSRATGPATNTPQWAPDRDTFGPYADGTPQSQEAMKKGDLAKSFAVAFDDLPKATRATEGQAGGTGESVDPRPGTGRHRGAAESSNNKHRKGPSTER